MDREVFLIGVGLSESAELAVSSFRRKLFQAAGYVSALALPPLIPLAWREQMPQAECLPFLDAAGAESTGFSSIPVLVDNAWFLGLKPETEAVMLRWRQLFSSAAEGWFPTTAGVFLCMEEAVSDSSAGQLSSPGREVFSGRCRLNDFRLECYRLSSSSFPLWWQDLYECREWSKHLRA